MTKALFRDGRPANLPAAALDALAWLRPALAGGSCRDVAKLTQCRAALEKYLAPHLPERYEETPCQDATDR